MFPFTLYTLFIFFYLSGLVSSSSVLLTSSYNATYVFVSTVVTGSHRSTTNVPSTTITTTHSSNTEQPHNACLTSNLNFRIKFPTTTTAAAAELEKSRWKEEIFCNIRTQAHICIIKNEK